MKIKVVLAIGVAGLLIIGGCSSAPLRTAIPGVQSVTASPAGIVSSASPIPTQTVASQNPAASIQNPDEDLLPVKGENGRYGYIDLKGNIIIIPQFEDALPFSDGLAPVSIGGKWGFCDKAGAVVIKAQYDYFEAFRDDYAMVSPQKGGNYIDKQGNIATPPQSWYPVNESEGPFAQYDKKSKKYGFVDRDKKYVIKPAYSMVDKFQEGMAAVQDPKSSKWGFIDTTGTLVIPCRYHSVEGGFQDGLAHVTTTEDGQTSALLDKTGKRIFDDLFTCGYSGEGMHWATDGNMLQFFDNKGNIKFTLNGDEADTYSEGLCAVGIYNPSGEEPYELFGYIDMNGDLVIDAKFGYAYPFKNGVARVDTTDNAMGSFGYIDRSGNYIWDPSGKPGNAAKPTATNATPKPTVSVNKNSGNDLFVAENSDGMYGYIDSAGKTAIPFSYSFAMPFSEGLAFVTVGDTPGYIDSAGNMVIVYPEKIHFKITDKLVQTDFHNGHALYFVENGSQLRWGVMDDQGNRVTPPAYIDAQGYSDGMVAVEDGSGRWGFLGSDYTVKLKPAYHIIYGFHEGFAAVQDGATYLFGFIDKDGNLKIPYRYNDTNVFSGGMAPVMDASGQWGYIDTTGKQIVPCTFGWVGYYGGGYGFAEGYDQPSTIFDNKGNVFTKNAFNYGSSGNGLYWWADCSSGALHFIDENGQEKLQTVADIAGIFSEGMCAVGRLVTDPEGSYYEYGYIDQNGQLVIDYQFSEAEPFKDGIAYVETKKPEGFDAGYIGKDGKYIWHSGHP